MRLRLALVLSLLALPAAASQLAHEKHVLDNGLTVILHEDRLLPTAVVNLWYGVGAKDEPEGRSGFAHLFEHLMFMGTERVPGSQFDQLMEAGGGWNNATTSFDRTNYFSSGPSSLLPTLLWLEADRLEDLGRMMTQEKLDLQREVVRNERRESENSPYGKADMLITEEMFPPGHPYHVSVIGTHEDLEAATVDDVTAFFDRFYLPSNCSLVVAGDFEPKATLALIEELFGSLPTRPVPPKAEAAPIRLTSPKTRILFDDVQHARTSLAWHSPAFYVEGDAEMDLLAGVLAGGKSSRLHRRLVREERAAIDVAAYQWSLKLGSLFVIEATAAPGVPLERVEGLIEEELAALREEGPTASELGRVRNDFEHGALRRLESLVARADTLNRYQHHFGEPDSLDRDLSRYREANERTVRAWARRVLDPVARLALRVLPENPRDTRPPDAAPAEFSFPAPESFQLSNGLQVHHWQRGELPLLAARLVLAGGSTLDAPAEAGLTASTLDMLDEGTTVRDAVAFANALEQLGAEFSTSTSYDHSTLELRALERTAADALALFAEALTRPAFDEDEWERVRDLNVARLEARADDPNQVARLVASRHLFGEGHPHATPISGFAESLRGLDADALRRRHAVLARPDSAVLLTAGRLPAEELRPVLESAFGSWTAKGPAAAAPKIAATPSRSSGPEVLLVHRPDAVQTVLRWAWPGPAAGAPERLGVRLLHEIFGGSFTSRLNSNLREDKGYTYGAGSGIDSTTSAGWAVASSSVRTDVTGASLAEFQAEFAAMRGSGLTAAERDKANAGLRTGLIDRTEGLDGLLSTAAAMIVTDRAPTALNQDLAAIAAWSLGALNEAAAAHFRPETGVLVLVGDRAQVLPQLEGLGLPQPREVDTEGRPLR